ncbi:MAG: hypothetical protein ACI8P3_002456 [Saprospiraceae bacterium]|jgi:hypothetical protein
MKDIIKLPIYSLIYVFGGLVFLFTQKTPKQSYFAMRYFYVLSNGKVNSFINRMLGFFYPKYQKIRASGILGDLSGEEVKSIVDSINENGFYEIETKLDPEMVEKLTAFGKATPTKVLDASVDMPRYYNELMLADENNIISPRYTIPNDQLLKNPSVQEIAFDKSFLAIANEFMQCKPVLSDIQMWWSFPFGGKAKSAAAQMYHFDMDRIKFLKFFFYLTDVGPETGPHCYIRKSNRIKPKAILSDGRKTDDLMKSHYAAEDMMELKGEKGSILIVDTSGWHKGKPLTKDKRLLLQIQYANSLFGAAYKELKLEQPSSNTFTKLIQTYAHTFKQVIKTK